MKLSSILKGDAEVIEGAKVALTEFLQSCSITVDETTGALKLSSDRGLELEVPNLVLRAASRVDESSTHVVVAEKLHLNPHSEPVGVKLSMEALFMVQKKREIAAASEKDRRRMVNATRRMYRRRTSLSCGCAGGGCQCLR